MPDSTHSAIKKALSSVTSKLPDVEIGIACKGTALESITYNIRKKAFLFVGPKDARLKRASGWVKIELSAPPPRTQLQAWIRESYGLMASTPARKSKKKAAKRGAKPRSGARNAKSAKSR